MNFVSCGLSLTMACIREQKSRWNWVIQGSLILRLPLIEKKATLWYNGKKSCFRQIFPDLEILCPIITFVLLPIFLSTEYFFEKFWCELEKNMFYSSRKTSPVGKDGFVVEVRHVLLTLSLSRLNFAHFLQQPCWCCENGQNVPTLSLNTFMLCKLWLLSWSFVNMV